MTTNLPTWQERIQACKDAGLSLSDIAKNIGISPQGLCDLAAGRNGEPKGMVAVKLHKLHLRMRRKAA